MSKSVDLILNLRCHFGRLIFHFGMLLCRSSLCCLRVHSLPFILYMRISPKINFQSYSSRDSPLREEVTSSNKCGFPALVPC